MLALGRDPSDQQHKLSPGFWKNLNRALAQHNPPLTAIDHKQPPWDDWRLIQEERHPFAHLGAGGGRFPRSSAARLAVEEAEKAIERMFALLGCAHPSWLRASVSWPQDVDPLQRAFGNISQVGISGTITHGNASSFGPSTIRVAIIHLDGMESCDYFPAGYNWQPRVETLLANLRAPIKGIRVYDGTRMYLDEPLLMWGGEH